MNIEEKALEAYPVELRYACDEMCGLFQYDCNEEKRKAYIKCYEDLMKEAKRVRVQTSPLNGPLGISAYCCNAGSESEFYHCKEGDYVNVIIVKDNG